MTNDKIKALKNKFTNRHSMSVSIFEGKQCSFFNSVDPAKGNRTVSVLDLLADKQYCKLETIEKIRECIWDSEEQSQLKASLTAATFSSIQHPNSRSKDNYIRPSGFIQFDIDNIQDPNLVKFKISRLPYTAYCGISARGKGVWGLFPIPLCDSETYGKHFNAMESLFYGMGFTDKQFDVSVKDISRIRFVSFDPLAYFNHKAKLYTDLKEPVKMNLKPLIPRTEYKPITNGKNLTASELIDKYNNEVSFDTIDNILQSAGYTHDKVKGEKVRYTRPGKKSSISADYDTNRRTFYIFSSNAPEYGKFKTSGSGAVGSPVDILMIYQTGVNNWREIFKEIRMEFGLK